MRLGIFGGTFDPVHWGHLILAEQCREQCQLDQVWFVPAGNPPHKAGLTVTPLKQRKQMLEFACVGLPRFEVHPLESEKDGATYTVDTLAKLKAERAEDELFFLIGGDSLSDLPTWRDPEGIVDLATLVAVGRGDQRPEIPTSLSQKVRDRIQIVDMPACGISSRDLRDRVQQNRSILFLAPRPVERYVVENGLYQDG